MHRIATPPTSLLRDRRWNARERQLAKLRKDLGEVFLAALADPDTVEICLNADGSLWQERLGEPLQPIGTMSASCADAAMRTIAAYEEKTRNGI